MPGCAKLLRDAHDAPPAPYSSTPIIRINAGRGNLKSRPSRIAIASDRDGDADIYVMDADGGNVQQLTDDPAGDWYPAWSPDGTRIAFASTRAGGS